MQFIEKWYYVYIMTNRSKTLYIGITSKLRLRIFQHKTGAFKGFTSEYKIDRLVYWEQYKNVNRAIAREKQLKGWRRIKKIQLIVSMNPTWNDLAADWYPELMHRSFDSAPGNLNGNKILRCASLRMTSKILRSDYHRPASFL